MSRILTEHQIRRIRSANADNIAKMVDQERYWMLSRSEALILMRTGEERQAIPIFRRVARSLSKKYPDEALAAYTDLICTMAKIGLNQEAVAEAKRASALLDQINFDIEPLGRRALEIAAESDQVEYGEAIEIRMLLRPATFAVAPRRKELVAVNS